MGNVISFNRKLKTESFSYTVYKDSAVYRLDDTTNETEELVGSRWFKVGDGTERNDSVFISTRLENVVEYLRATGRNYVASQLEDTVLNVDVIDSKEGTLVQWDQIAEKNKQVQDKLRKERATSNTKVLKLYRIK